MDTDTVCFVFLDCDNEEGNDAMIGRISEPFRRVVLTAGSTVLGVYCAYSAQVMFSRMGNRGISIEYSFAWFVVCLLVVVFSFNLICLPFVWSFSDSRQWSEDAPTPFVSWSFGVLGLYAYGLSFAKFDWQVIFSFPEIAVGMFSAGLVSVSSFLWAAGYRMNQRSLMATNLLFVLGEVHLERSQYKTESLVITMSLVASCFAWYWSFPWPQRYGGLEILVERIAEDSRSVHVSWGLTTPEFIFQRPLPRSISAPTSKPLPAEWAILVPIEYWAPEYAVDIQLISIRGPGGTLDVTTVSSENAPAITSDIYLAGSPEAFPFDQYLVTFDFEYNFVVKVTNMNGQVVYTAPIAFDYYPLPYYELRKSSPDVYNELGILPVGHVIIDENGNKEVMSYYFPEFLRREFSGYTFQSRSAPHDLLIWNHRAEGRRVTLVLRRSFSATFLTLLLASALALLILSLRHLKGTEQITVAAAVWIGLPTVRGMLIPRGTTYLFLDYGFVLGYFTALALIYRQVRKVSAPAQARTPPAPDKKGSIKGNTNRKREKIYHVPGGRYYASVKDPVSFTSEEDAIAAGYRRSKV